MIKLAAFFDVSTDYLLGLSSLYYPDLIKNSVELTPDEESILQDFRSLPRAERAQAAEYVHYLADRFGKNKRQKA